MLFFLCDFVIFVGMWSVCVHVESKCTLVAVGFVLVSYPHKSQKKKKQCSKLQQYMFDFPEQKPPLDKLQPCQNTGKQQWHCDIFFSKELLWDIHIFIEFLLSYSSNSTKLLNSTNVEFFTWNIRVCVRSAIANDI